MWCFDMHYMYFRLVIHCKSYNQKSLNFVTKNLVLVVLTKT